MLDSIVFIWVLGSVCQFPQNSAVLNVRKMIPLPKVHICEYVVQQWRRIKIDSQHGEWGRGDVRVSARKAWLQLLATVAGVSAEEHGHSLETRKSKEMELSGAFRKEHNCTKTPF